MTHMTIASSYLGTKELKGSADNPKIMEMYRTVPVEIITRTRRKVVSEKGQVISTGVMLDWLARAIAAVNRQPHAGVADWPLPLLPAPFSNGRSGPLLRRPVA
jgi:hypothetical protein